MPVPEQLAVRLAHCDAAPREAREQVRAFLDLHHLDGEVAELALVIVSELATNAVVHASPPITLEVAVSDHVLELAICDADACAAVLAARRPDSRDLSGRGLELVASFARNWGVQTDRDGKRVWAQLAVPTSNDGASACSGPAY